MPDIYILIVVLLFGLAISDLIVGVSNDAVNFLNSAVGSKVAPRHIILVVASLGVFVGATFSSGMMEIARKGIFNPEFFFFAEIMVIFMAVMFTDIILLDFFNTFGLPTSTTVSIIFELLGAAVAVSVFKIAAAGESFSLISQHINSSSVLGIMSGILLSIGIAFFFGIVIQYFSRLLFSFHYERRMKMLGSIWSGLALTALTYFLVIKGLKGASFVTESFLKWVTSHTMLLLGISMIFWTITMQILHTVFKVNILRIVVLFGTFSLAMAFAGNDLVNFIGVPIAGFESFIAWSRSGADAEAYSMEILTEPVRTKTFLLLLAGIVMVLTLWFSKKARTVTDTEVNLGRQDEGSERFSPNAVSRWIVRYSVQAGKSIQGLIPNSWLEKAENSFMPVSPRRDYGKEYDPPAFDLVRASVNLTVASMLIALATSLKLPLSTTYVSFMVAMGTSLADRAWDRDSAVYRIAGVLNVIAGWFFTALIAFTVSAVFATLLYWFGVWAISGLIALSVLFISRTFFLHRKRAKEIAGEEAFERRTEVVPASRVLKDTSLHIAENLSSIRAAFGNVISGLLEEDASLLKKAGKEVKELSKSNKDLKKKLYGAIRRIEEYHTEGSRIYLLVHDLDQDILQSATYIVEICKEHVENVHKPLEKNQGKHLATVKKKVDHFLGEVIGMMENYDFSRLDALLEEKSRLFTTIEDLITLQVEGIKNQQYGRRNSLLYFSLLLETKDLIAVAARFAKLFDRVQRSPLDEDLHLLTRWEKTGSISGKKR